MADGRWRELCTVPNGLWAELRTTDGAELLGERDPRRMRRELDLRDGRFRRTIDVRGGVRLSVERFASYRDPHVEETLAVYQRAIGYIKSGDYSEEDIKESVLQVCSDIDKPETPAERGTRAFHRRLTALTHEKRKAFKQGVMETTREKVLAAARDHFPESREDLATAVISSEEKLQAANRSLSPPLTISTI